MIDFRRMEHGPDREAARRAAYVALFSTELGRVVLRDMADDVGLAAIRGPGVDANIRDYLAGQQDVVITLAQLSGVDVTALALSLAQNDEQQGYYDGRNGFDDEG